MNNFNVYDNIRTPQVKNYTTIEEWFKLIKDSQYKELILQARGFGKGHTMYDSLKSIIPAITYNFTFKDSKSNKNISGSTGLLYIDIDDSSFDISILDLTKVFSYYKSFGGNGYSILVKVEVLTLENYNSTYSFICNELGLSSYFDKGAKKATQFNVLSFDPNIYINNNSTVFQSVNTLITTPVTIEDSNIQNSTPSIVIKEREKAYTTNGVEFDKYKKIRVNNLNEIEFEGMYTVNWDGYEFINSWIPIQKIKVNRNNFLLSYTNNLIYLNPHLSKVRTFEIVNNVNKVACEIPVTLTQVKSVVNSVFKYKEDGTLKPILNKKKRKIIFKEGCELTKEEKLAICRKENAAKKSSGSVAKLYSIIESWDFKKYGKITQSSIHTNFNITNKTVIKYWSEFKGYIKDLNDNYKDTKNASHGEAITAPIKQLIVPKVSIQPEPTKEPVMIDKSIKVVDYYDGHYSMLFQGYKTFETILSTLTSEQAFQLKLKVLENIAAKEVNTFDIEVEDLRLSFYSDEVMLPAKVQLKAIA